MGLTMRRLLWRSVPTGLVFRFHLVNEYRGVVMAKSIVRLLLVFLFLLHGYGLSFADDTCVFAVTANDVPPNVAILLDTGSAMEQVVWNSGYNHSVTYPGSFISIKDYGYERLAGKDYLAPFADLGTFGALDGTFLMADGGTGRTFTVTRDDLTTKTLTLPNAPSGSGVSVDLDGDGSNDASVIDKAVRFRFSGNYLNWLFHYKTVSDLNGDGINEPLYDGSALESKTRLFYAKKAILTMAHATGRKAKFALYDFTTTAGASKEQPMGFATNAAGVLDSNFVNKTNAMSTTSYSPLAEGLASVGGEFNSSSMPILEYYCQKNFIIVISPGVSSKDITGSSNSYVPKNQAFSDYDGDGYESAGDPVGKIKWGAGATADNGIGIWYDIPVAEEGSTYLDDIAFYLWDNDVITYNSAPPGFQNLLTYTIGFMGNEINKRFLINTSNNGNGNKNLYDTSNPDYGKYHFDASSPEGLSQALMDALSSILERTNAFAAPVVPVTRTTSGNRLYMAFFAPKASSNFWEGNVVKFGIDSSQNIVDKNNNPATFANGAIRDDAVPYWETIDWATIDKTNYILNSNRNIYTYLGASTNLADAANHFKTDNAGLTAAILGNPAAPRTTAEIINYVRGADVFDEDGDGSLTENRALITGDVLHSEPMVYQYIKSADSLTVIVTAGSFQAGELIRGSKGGFATVDTPGVATITYNTLKAPFTAGETIRGLDSGATATVSSISDTTMVFFGSNDGMLHAVRDTNGTEAWAFIPPNQLSRLRLMIDGTGHQYYVDASPKVYLYDVNGNGFIDLAHGDKVILVSGERKGSTGYFALDVTEPEAPILLWRINQTNDLAYAPPTVVIPELGESWSEPRFGKVKTTDLDSDTGTAVVFVGGGYSSTNAAGKAVLAINVLTGQVVKKFVNDTDGNALTGTNISGMDYSIPSTLRILDSDRNGFIDKLYVGDAGGQLWRIGRFTESDGTTPLVYPNADENINNWRGQRLLSAGCNETSCTDNVDNNSNGLIDERRRFFYPPTVTTEIGYDLVFVSSGDRENPCHGGTSDAMYAVKDNHTLLPVSTPPPAALTQADLVNALVSAPNLAGSDKGWYLPLASGEKVLGENTVFAGVLYFTTFTPGSEPCVPGGLARLYAVTYKTGAAVIHFDNDGITDRSLVIGGGIPSRPVVVIGDEGQGMFISVGSTNPDATSESVGAGSVKPPMPGFVFNLRRIWWKER